MTPPPTAVTPLRRNRDFAILWSGQAVSMLGSSMSALVFPLVGYAITRSTAQAGLGATAVLLGGVVARLPAGALADRWSRRRVLGVANLAGALTYGSLAAAALAHHLTLAHLVVAGFLGGVAGSFVSPASAAAVRTVVPPAQLPVAFSALQARRQAAQLSGPPLGGALYSVARGLPFLVDGATYAVAALSLAWLRSPLPAPGTGTGTRGTVLADVAEGLRFVRRHAVVRAILVWGAVINVAVEFVLVVVTLRLVRAGVAPAAIGLVDTIAAAAGLLGALVAPAIVSRMRTGVTTIATGTVLAVVVVPMAWTDDVVAIGALLAVGFFLVPANNSGIGAYMTVVTPGHMQGRLESTGGFVTSAVQPLAPALAGTLLGSLGGPAATLVGAALLASSLAPLLASEAIRGLGRPAAWAAADPPAAAS